MSELAVTSVLPSFPIHSLSLLCFVKQELTQTDKFEPLYTVENCD